MGKRGPLPLPDALRADTRRHRRREEARPGVAPRAPSGEPEAPSFLDAEGRAAWDRLTTSLRERGALSRADRGVISIAAAAWSRFLAAERQGRDEGRVVAGARGQPRRHPADAIARQAQADYVRAVSRLLDAPPAKGAEDGEGFFT